MSNLNNIVNINIDIAAPAADSASFDNLLIVGPPPAAAASALPDVAVYGSLSEVSAAGYKVTGDDADPVGIAARIAFSQNPKPPLIYVAAIKTDADDEPEPPAETLDRALETPGWYVICPVGIPEREYEQIAEWTEAHVKQMAYTFLSDSDPVGEIFFRSHGWCGLVHDSDLPADTPQANAYLHVAAAAKCLSYPAGAETWAFKRLASVYPSQLSGTLAQALANGHSNYFTQIAGRNVTMNGQVRAGEWIDIIRGRDWLQNDMQLRIFSLMIMNPKIPFTNNGIALVQNEMIASLKAATTRGIVAEDEFDEDGTLVPGFTTYVPNALTLTATQKAARVLQDCRFSARLAGAIHAVRVDGALTY